MYLYLYITLFAVYNKYLVYIHDGYTETRWHLYAANCKNVKKENEFFFHIAASHVFIPARSSVIVVHVSKNIPSYQILRIIIIIII